MTVTIGNTTISGLSVGGLPSASVVTADIATNTIPYSVFSNLMGNSKAGNGYTYLPSGLIIQWGYKASPGTSGTINWNITFPTAFLNAQMVEFGLNDTGGTAVSNAWASEGTTTSITYSSQSTTGFFWMSVGY